MRKLLNCYFFRGFCGQAAMLGKAFFISVCLFLVACGGGSAVPNSTPSSITIGSAFNNLSGTAATGAPISNAILRAKCFNSQGNIISKTFTSNVDGGFNISALEFDFTTAVYLPCLVQVEIKDGTNKVIERLHGLATTANVSGSTIVNVTPLTEAILMAGVATEDIVNYYNALTDVQLSNFTSLNTTGIWDILSQQLRNNGIDTSSILGSPLSHSFNADSTGHDAVLDNLKTKGYSIDHLYRISRNLPVPPKSATGLLNDTGIVWCTENITIPPTWINNAVCRTVNWLGNLWGQQQDAFFGRDAHAMVNTLTKIGSGAAGFDYTRIGANGRPLLIQNATWDDNGSQVTSNGWDCVRDNHTGLLWEVKRNDNTHLRHMMHTYTWFNPDVASNGGDAGNLGGKTCAGVADVNQCNTQSYVTAVNATGLCGYTDWRLPTPEELLSIAHLGRNGPAIDTDHFPNTVASGPGYWTALPVPNVSSAAWMVGSNFGGYTTGTKGAPTYVRLVRSERSPN